MDGAPANVRLRADSPMIDAANPDSPEPGAPSTDVDGNPRRVEGDGDSVARADKGAFEFQPQAPTAAATSAPSTVLTGEEATFDGSGSSDPDPGDVLTFLWTFDDGTTASGAVVRKAFAGPGPHAGALTVSDRQGATATATTGITVVEPPPPPAPCANVTNGTRRPNRLTGGPLGDLLRGFAGNDRLRGLAGDDCLFGGAGRDRLDGGPGNDRLRGQAGNDRLVGGAGGDTLVGGGGTNRYSAGGGGDSVNSGNGRRETVDCGGGTDVARVDRRDLTRRCERVR